MGMNNWKTMLIAVIIAIAYLFKTVNEIEIMNIIANIYLILMGYFIAGNDIKTKKIPNKYILILMGGWSVCASLMIIMNIEIGVIYALDGIKGLIFGGGFYLFIYVISRKGLGAGDVKFMGSIGLFMGVANTFPAIMFTAIFTALYSVVMLLLKKMTMKSKIAMAPFMYLSIITILFIS